MHVVVSSSSLMVQAMRCKIRLWTSPGFHRLPFLGYVMNDRWITSESAFLEALTAIRCAEL